MEPDVTGQPRKMGRDFGNDGTMDGPHRLDDFVEGDYGTLTKGEAIHYRDSKS